MEANQYAISAAELQRISSAARSELSSLVACQTRKLLVKAAKHGHTRAVLTLLISRRRQKTSGFNH